MAVTRNIVKIEFSSELLMTVPRNIATFVFTAKSESVSETTIEVSVPWTGDLVAAEQAALKELEDFGKRLG